MRGRGRRTTGGRPSRIGWIKSPLLIFQNRFALRLITATKRDFVTFLGKKDYLLTSFWPKFPYCKSFYIQGLGQMVFQNLKGLLYLAGDGSRWQSHLRRIFNSEWLRIICFPIFSTFAEGKR